MRETELARCEYIQTARVRRKEQEEDKRRRGEEEEGTYLANEGGWKVNYLWKVGRYTMRGEERRVKG